MSSRLVKMLANYWLQNRTWNRSVNKKGFPIRKRTAVGLPSSAESALKIPLRPCKTAWRRKYNGSSDVGRLGTG